MFFVSVESTVTTLVLSQIVENNIMLLSRARRGAENEKKRQIGKCFARFHRRRGIRRGFFFLFLLLLFIRARCSTRLRRRAYDSIINIVFINYNYLFYSRPVALIIHRNYNISH